ncbi:phosphatase PAP2 family protein [Streptomyces griseus]|uniref:phosphatase PAP2 family protein n=1 Tax=Streptomyces griseus TaxID=1911 RepID=UPI0008400654|nr:phosphatase PAP2 family protein [Streptomyces griseus]
MGESLVTTQEDRTAVTPSPRTDEAAAADRPALRPRWSGRLGSLRSPRRPRLWFEILLIAVSYWLYSLVRNAVPEQKAAALRNADLIWSLEHGMGLAFEESVNHAVNSVTWLIVSMNYYYATLHFVVTIGVLVWLFRRHPGRYAPARLILFATTAVALLGYYLFPLAPPRLMRGESFVDTVMLHQTWGSMASGNFKHMSNQYAAMPSMHIGWSLWCGLTICALATAPWARILGLLYPFATLIVIVSTANHFWLDAVGGMACLAFGYALSYAWYGALPHRLPKVVPRSARQGRLRALLPGPAAPSGRPEPDRTDRTAAPSGRPEPDRTDHAAAPEPDPHLRAAAPEEGRPPAA